MPRTQPTRSRKTAHTRPDTLTPAPLPVPQPPWVCAQCLADPHLHHLAASSRDKHRCIACGRIRKGMTLEKLSSHVANVLNTFYQRAPTGPEGMEWLSFTETGQWFPPGNPLSHLLQELMGANESVALAVCKILQRFGGKPGDRFEEGAFATDAHYVEAYLFPDISKFNEFEAFEHRLRYQARYSHPESRRVLESVFAGVERLVTRDGDPVAVVVQPSSPLGTLYRARVFQSTEDLKKAMIEPERELGPPPAKLAQSGRMNAARVSVFYGATDPSVAIAEVRPPAHCHVLVGAFQLRRQVRLLSVCALQSVMVQGSKFEPAHQARLRHADFLRLISARISRPVLPIHQEEAYLVTQAMADFLAFELAPGFDGMIFPSTQSDAGDNVVLFQGAARVEFLPSTVGARVEADLEFMGEDGPEPDFRVVEWINDPKAPPPALVEEPTFSAAERELPPVTLHLDRKSLRAHFIERVHYESQEHEVTRSTHDLSEPREF